MLHVSQNWGSRLISCGLMILASLIGTFLIGTGTASAQDRRQNNPGEFDYYVLSLSWSPSFCEEAEERGGSGRSQQAQCGGRPPLPRSSASSQKDGDHDSDKT